MLEQKRKREGVCFFLIVMIICQLFIITRFSAQTAGQSSAESNGFLEKVIEFLTRTEKENIDAGVYHILHNLIRTLAHFVNFYILGFVCIMLGDELYTPKEIRMYMAVFIFGLAVACLDEVHQCFVPGRSAQFVDVCIDFSGVIAGSILFLVLKKVFKC